MFWRDYCLVFTVRVTPTRAKTLPGVVKQQSKKVLAACGFNSVIQFNLIQTCWVYAALARSSFTLRSQRELIVLNLKRDFANKDIG